MSDKLVTMKQFNGTGYDEILPKTIAQQIPDLTEAVGELGYSKIEYGSYVGTGTYGGNNPNTLIFSFVPKLVIVRDAVYTLCALYGMERANTSPNGHYSGVVSLTWSGQTLSWNTTDYSANSSVQLNTQDTTYHYLVVG